MIFYIFCLRPLAIKCHFLCSCALSQKPTTVAAIGDCSVHIPLQTACSQWSHSHMAHHKNIFMLTGQTQGLPRYEVDTNDCYHCESVDFTLTAV